MAVIAAVALGACGAVTPSGEAFSVDGTSFSRQEMNALTSDLVKVGQIPGTNGGIGSKDMAGIASTMIQYTAGKQVLDKSGVTIDAADVATARGQLGASELTGLSKDTIDLLSQFSAMGKAFDRIKIPADVERMYDRSPASTGVLCVSEITVATEDDARGVLDRLASGESFAKVASATTLNKEFKATSGNVEDANGSSCFTLGYLLPKLGQALLGALYRTSVGTPTNPVQDESGWHVAVHRPWSEISADHAAALADRTGRQLLAGFLATADIRVNSTYGTWNPVLAQVE